MQVFRRLAPTVLVAACAFPSTQVLRGTLVKVERDERYEPRCGILTFVILHKDCDRENPRAYHATVAADSTVPAGAAGRITFFFFAPKGNRIPLQGTAAVWVLHRHAIYRLADCLDIGCPSSLDYMLVSDSDVRPLGEWNRLIDSLGRKAS